MSKGRIRPETVSSCNPDRTESAQEGSRLMFGLSQDDLIRAKKRNNLELQESNSNSDSYSEIIDCIQDINKEDTDRQLLMKKDNEDKKKILNEKHKNENEIEDQDKSSVGGSEEIHRFNTNQTGKVSKKSAFKSQLLLPKVGINVQPQDSDRNNNEDSDKIEPLPNLKPVEDNSQSNKEVLDTEETQIEFKLKSKAPKKKCFCRQLDQGKIKWDLFIMLLAIINCFQVPYSVAFTDIDSSIIYLDIINLCIDFIFILDVIISFRTSVILESTAQEIYDNKKIAVIYLKGRFWIDFPASIPFDLFTYIFPILRSNQLTLQMIGLLKLVRVLRLSRLITYLNVKSELKMSLKLVKLIFFLILFLHCLACIWFFIVKQNETWIPPLDYVWVETELYDQGAFHQYLNALYHAVLMLGGNDVGPRGNFQLTFVSITLLAAAIINANIFGNMAVILQSLNKKATNFQEKLDNANETMKNLRIPRALQEEIKDYFTFTQNTQDHQSDLKIFMSTLSPSLRQKVISSIFKGVLVKNPIFNMHNAAINQILGTMETCLFLPENKIITQNQEGNMMYFIAHGECDVTVLTEKQKEIHVSTIKEGDFFGEVALIKKCKRTASVISKNYTTLASFHENDFDSLIEEYPFIKQKMESKMIDEYNDPWKKFVKKVLRNIDYLSYCVSDETIEEIVYFCEPITISENTQLFKAGSKCQDIYIISDGELDISVNNANKETFLDTLHIGSSIGSYCALVNEPYSISGKSRTTCKLLKLPIKKLFSMREQVEDLDYNMTEYEQYIDENGLPYCDYRIYRHGHLKLRPIQKFQVGIRRIINILRSYKSLDLRGLLDNVKNQIKKQKEAEKNKRKSAMLRGNPMTAEQKADEYYYSLKSEMRHVQSSMVFQNKEMLHLFKKTQKQIQNLHKLIKGESVVEDPESSNESKHDEAFKNLSSDPRQPMMRKVRDRGLSKAMRKITNTNVSDLHLELPGSHVRKKSMNSLMPSNFQDPITTTHEQKAYKNKLKLQKSKSFHQDKHYKEDNLTEKEESKRGNLPQKNKIVVLKIKDEYQDAVRLMNQDSSLEKPKPKAETMEQPLVMRRRSLTMESPDSMIKSENKTYDMPNELVSSVLKHRKYASIIRKNQKIQKKSSILKLDTMKSDLS
ncbi:unnamed protein product [Moneuplotes crassus]|uniref:Cyclic nucleotide-binding domain-containing protein n=1 Tax=Euplotes crassus TaxID=5936 RepID=A0AAD1XFY4_EUPCR|nr:unnamed protein product [Moneuplotes crassus]